MALETLLFYVLGTLAVGSSLLVIGQRNPVYSVMLLIASFASLAGIYVLLDAPFTAVTQIIVYAGAIMVLFLFVIMLLNLGHDLEPDVRGTGWKVMAGGGSLVLIALLARVFSGDLTAPLGQEAGPATLAAQQAQEGVVGVIAVPLYGEFVVPLQATAMLLLIAVVGAVVLARRKV